jgi:hypothetical protein
MCREDQRGDAPLNAESSPGRRQEAVTRSDREEAYGDHSKKMEIERVEERDARWEVIWLDV